MVSKFFIFVRCQVGTSHVHWKSFKFGLFKLFLLVVATNPFEKYARKIGSLPQIGMKTKHIWNHHQVLLSFEKHKDCV